MKVLFTNRPKDVWIGGDYIQMERTAEELRKIGVEVEIIESGLLRPAIRIREFDIIHNFNFSMEWAKYSCWMANLHQKPWVSSMIYAETNQFVTYDKQQIMIDNCQSAIFLNEGEVERAKRQLKIKDDIIKIIPNGIDDFWFQTVKDKNKHGDYILTVGRIEPFKGQLAVAKACKRLGYKYICVGERLYEDYAKEVEDAGAIILPPMAKEELIKMYKHAKLMVLASRAELMSLAVMEAMAQNCPIVLTDHSEWKPNDVSLCKYDSVSSIKNAIKKEYGRKVNHRKEMKKYKWEEVAKQLKQVYESITSS
jgi:glycosyltransferase involved in cell wall biosynthesis